MCTLRVTGKDFDPQLILSGTGLKPCAEHRFGEPMKPWDPDGPKSTTSGFNVSVSDAVSSNLALQVADACAFLDRHCGDIRALQATGEVEQIRLDFPVELRIGDHVAAQFEFFPPALVARAGALNIGLELSIYPPSDNLSDDPPTSTH